MVDHSKTPHTLVTAFKPKEDKKAQSPLETHFEAMRATTEKEIGYLKMAAEACKDAGYDISNMEGYKLIRFLQDAVKTLSDANGRYYGDAFKSFDPDMAFPTKTGLVLHMHRECPKNNIPKIVIPAEPEFKFA